MLTTEFVTGSPNWLELRSPDTAVAATFYAQVFGWDFQPAYPRGRYGFFIRDGRMVAALGPHLEPGTAPAWTVYFQSPDVEATAGAVEKSGGEVRIEPRDVVDLGRMACLADPSGAQFAVWQPARLAGLDEVDAEATLCWLELRTDDPGGAERFYRPLFGWAAADYRTPDASYRTLSAGDGTQAAAGRMFGEIATARAGEPVHWEPYFRLADVDALAARVVSYGGRLLAGPEDVPGVGRVCGVADPQGASFSVLGVAGPGPSQD